MAPEELELLDEELVLEEDELLEEVELEVLELLEEVEELLEALEDGVFPPQLASATKTNAGKARHENRFHFILIIVLSKVAGRAILFRCHHQSAL